MRAPIQAATATLPAASTAAGRKRKSKSQEAGSAAPAAADKVLNVYNWSDWVDAAMSEAFRKETGIAVRDDVVVAGVCSPTWRNPPSSRGRSTGRGLAS